MSILIHTVFLRFLITFFPVVRIHRCNDLNGRNPLEGSESYVAYDFGESGGGERRGGVHGASACDGSGGSHGDPEGQISIRRIFRA